MPAIVTSVSLSVLSESKRRAVLAIAGSACLFVAACESDDDWDLAPDVTPIAPQASAPESYAFIDSHYLGEGILEDSRGILATSKTGLLAVSEPALCRITVFRFAGGAPLYQAGKCGAGPDEFRVASGLSFWGDTLVVIDPALRRIILFDSAGQHLYSGPVTELVGDLSISIPDIAFLGRDRIATHPVRSSTDHLVSIIDSKTHELVATTLQKIQAARRSPERVAGMGVRMCSTGWESGPAIIAQSAWQFEAVALNTEGHVLWRSLTRVDWFGQYEYQGTILPAALMRRPICGSDAVLLRTSRTLPSAPPTATLQPGYFEVRGSTGALLIGREMQLGEDYLIEPGASWREFWGFSDPGSLRPRIKVVKLARTVSASAKDG